MALKWQKTEFKHPQARARGLGSARDGVHHWINQRLTAVANIPLTLWMVWSVVRMHGAGYAEFTTFLAQPLNAILMILFILSVFYHAALGCQVIIEDYFHNEAFKITKLVGMKMFFITITVASVFSVLKIAFGG